MSNFNINLNLRALKSTIIKDVQGKTATKQCLIIPIADNDLFVGEKGGVYLNLSAWESNNLKDGKTHLVKQSPSRKVREAMTNEERKSIPILGDMKPFENASATVKSEGVMAVEDNDDLPF
jgi:hypothetical protein